MNNEDDDEDEEEEEAPKVLDICHVVTWVELLIYHTHPEDLHTTCHSWKLISREKKMMNLSSSRLWKPALIFKIRFRVFS